MMRVRSTLRFIAAAAAAALAGIAHAADTPAAQVSPPSPAPCQLVLLESLDMDTLPSGEFAVSGLLNGKPFELEVDTGSAFSSITSDAAEQLGLPIHLAFTNGAFLNNVGMNRAAFVDSMAFGKIHSNVRWPLMITPRGFLSPNINGLMGPDVLSHYDIELDFFKGKMNFFDPNTTCPSPVYWSQEYAAMPVQINGIRHVVATAVLDGKPVTVALDTGSASSVMSLDAARALFGWDENDPRVKYAKTISLNGGKPAPFYKYPFATLNFGGVAVQNPKIDLIPKANFGGDEKNTEIVLGMGVLRQMHIYISYPRAKMYVTGAEVRSAGAP